MKRYREAEVADSISVANVLVLLARGGGEGIIGISTSRSLSPDRIFECKTCSRRFPSFQALGGHRSSHKRSRFGADDGHAELPKPRAHECSVCGLEFPIGQALGGHMRRHRRTGAAAAFSAAAFADAGVEKEEKELWDLDLNMSPADREVQLRPNKIFGFELVESAPVVVDCFH